MTAPSGTKERFHQIDTLRAFAALLVLWVHASEGYLKDTATPFLHALRLFPEAWVPGRVAVVLFFCISGFVIQSSLESPAMTSGKFAIRRFFRLFPLYWATVIAGGLCFHGPPATLPFAEMIGANLTMLPSFLGQPEVLGLYWTLEVELFFYLLCLVLFRLGLLRRGGALCAVGAVLALLFIVLQKLGHAGILDWTNTHRRIPLHLAIMCWGALFRLLYRETGGLRTEWSRLVRLPNFGWLLALTAACLAWFAVNARQTPLNLIAYAIPLALFALWAGVGRKPHPLAEWLGRISYSIYLLHAFTTAFLDPYQGAFAAWGNGGAVLYLATVCAITVTLAWASYAFIEAPAIAWGRRLSATPKPAAP